MHRIDSSGSVDGLFQDGNPAVGQQATQLTAAWFNDVQENIAFAIEDAGLDLAKGDGEQLRDAIVALIAGVVGDGSGAVPTTRQVLGGGLISGGGPLTADRVLTLLKASSAEVIAGVLDDRAVTPLALAALFTAGIGDNGFIRLPGGGLIQMGQLRGSIGEGTVSVTFPTSFPTQCNKVIPVAFNDTASNQRDGWVQNYAQTIAGATFYVQYAGSGSTPLAGLDYIAIGK